MNKQRNKTKSKIRPRRSSPSIDGDIDTAKNSRTAGNQFHPMNNTNFENEHMTDMESAQYVGRTGDQQTNDAESDVPPRFIENETLHQDNKFKSAME